MKLVSKLLYGNRTTMPRWRDEKGNLPPLDRFLINGPRAMMSGIGRCFFGLRPERPWMSYAAVAKLEKFLDPKKSRILEYGSGMSTVWYARHAKEVYSVEDNSDWYSQTKKLLASKNVTNVRYHFKSTPEEYCHFADDSQELFDLIIVDGLNRSGCARQATKLIADGGIIYLDNSDKDSDITGGDTRVAEQILRDYAASRPSSIQCFTDFAPTQFFVEEGMCVELT